MLPPERKLLESAGWHPPTALYVHGWQRMANPEPIRVAFCRLGGVKGLNFDLNEEQALLRDLIERFAADRYDAMRRLAYARLPRGYCPQGWAILAEMGVLAFPFASDIGGFGGGSVELITVMEALGRVVAVEPLLPVVLLAGGLIERAGTSAQKAEWLPRLIGGETMIALAHTERGARFNQQSVSSKAITTGDGIRLTGAKQMVLGGSFADMFVVSAIGPDETIGLYMADADAPGVQLRSYRLSDGSMASDLTLDQVPAVRMSGGADALNDVYCDARLAICAELLGLMTMMFDAALEHVKTRQQFGQPIGSFQAIQHRMADHLARLELSRSQLYRAAATDKADPAREAAVTGAKAFISANAMVLGEDAVQLHGGIGTTEELLVGQAFKRVMLLASLFGDSDWELRRYVALSRG